MTDLRAKTMNAIDAVEEWWRIGDKLTEKWLEGHASVGQIPSCHKCTKPGCCYQKNLITIMEALPLARRIVEQGQNTPELRERFRLAGEAMEGTAKEVWLRELHPCVFLENNRCTAYDLRPVTCRSYYVMSPPEDCWPDKKTDVLVFDNTEHLTRLMLAAHQFHNQIGLKQTTHQIIIGSLPRMVWMCLEVWELDDPIKFFRSQQWPSQAALENGWDEGNNSFRDLVRIRRRGPEDNRGRGDGG